MVKNEEGDASDSEEEHDGEKESDTDELWRLYFCDYVMFLFGSCRFVYLTACLWAKNQVCSHFKGKWFPILLRTLQAFGFEGFWLQSQAYSVWNTCVSSVSDF